MEIKDISTPLSLDELWRHTVKALDNGDFTWLGELLAAQNVSLISLLEANGEPEEYMNEAFTWACFEGRTDDAEMLLNKGVDPAAGTRTGLAGFHWAANRGNLETVKMLIERKAPLEQVNIYGGTVVGSAFHAAVYEPRENIAEIIGLLIEAGANIEPRTLEWWEKQSVPSEETKRNSDRSPMQGKCGIK